MQVQRIVASQRKAEGVRGAAEEGEVRREKLRGERGGRGTCGAQAVRESRVGSTAAGLGAKDAHMDGPAAPSSTGGKCFTPYIRSQLWWKWESRPHQFFRCPGRCSYPQNVQEGLSPSLRASQTADGDTGTG